MSSRFVGAAVLFVVLGCGRAPRAPAPSVAGLVAPLHAELAEIEARLSALDARRGLAAACAEACVPGVASLRFRPGELACRCRQLPNLGVHRLASKPASARVPGEHAGAPSQVLRDEPGAGIEANSSAGLSSEGGPRG